jgi:hypothetical protein
MLTRGPAFLATDRLFYHNHYRNMSLQTAPGTGSPHDLSKIARQTGKQTKSVLSPIGRGTIPLIENNFVLKKLEVGLASRLVCSEIVMGPGTPVRSDDVLGER